MESSNLFAPALITFHKREIPDDRSRRRHTRASCRRDAWPGGASRAGALSRRLAAIDVLASELESQEAPRAATTLTRSEEKVLTAGGFDLLPVRAEAADPVARATAEYARLLHDSLSVVEAARRLGVNESRARQRLTSAPRSLFGVKHGREWRLPGFQFTERGLVPGIERAIKPLDPAIHPVACTVGSRRKTPTSPSMRGEAPERTPSSAARATVPAFRFPAT